MRVKVTETIVRDCCEPKDLVEYKGERTKNSEYPESIYFCKHCGQLWFYESYVDGAGDVDERLTRINI